MIYDWWLHTGPAGSCPGGRINLASLYISLPSGAREKPLNIHCLFLRIQLPFCLPQCRSWPFQCFNIDFNNPAYLFTVQHVQNLSLKKN